jgi:hypothetical protein
VDVLLAHELDGILQCVVIGSGEDGQTRRFREQVPFGVVDAKPEVADLVDDGVV